MKQANLFTKTVLTFAWNGYTYIASSSLLLLFQRKVKNVSHGKVNNVSDLAAPVAHVDAVEFTVCIKRTRISASGSLFSVLSIITNNHDHHDLYRT